VDSNPAGTQNFLSYECCVLSFSVHCIGLITRPEDSCLVRCFQWVWYRITLREGHNPLSVRSATEKIKGLYCFEIWSVSDQKNIFVIGNNILKCDKKLFFLNNHIRRNKKYIFELKLQNESFVGNLMCVCYDCLYKVTRIFLMREIIWKRNAF
jgi:hypothetical protein